jgi:hypothetical protein
VAWKNNGGIFTGMDEVIDELCEKLPIKTITAQVGIGINRDENEFEASPEHET